MWLSRWEDGAGVGGRMGKMGMGRCGEDGAVGWVGVGRVGLGRCGEDGTGEVWAEVGVHIYMGGGGGSGSRWQ